MYIYSIHNQSFMSEYTHWNKLDYTNAPGVVLLKRVLPSPCLPVQYLAKCLCAKTHSKLALCNVTKDFLFVFGIFLGGIIKCARLTRLRNVNNRGPSS